MPERAGRGTGRKMLSIRGGMGNYGSAITGHGKISGIDQTKAHGREDCKEEKDLLQSGFRIVRGGQTDFDVINDIPGGGSTVIIIIEFAISTDDLLRFFTVFTGKEE